MGQVYRARDTKLGRDVALKILPAAVAHDADRLARFEREAKTLASLNHANIAQIYDAGRLRQEPATASQGGEVAYLAMELVEGEDLSAHISVGRCRRPTRCPLPDRSPWRWMRHTSSASFIAT